MVFDKVAPCFPPHYKIFDVLRKEYHRQIAAMLDVIGMCADYLSNSDILDVRDHAVPTHPPWHGGD